MQIETAVVGDFEVNCFLVWGNARQAIVIDPGADADEIIRILKQRDLTVAAVLHTHGHVDHISGLADLSDRFPAPIGIHPADGTWAFSPRNQMLPYYAPPRQPANRIDRELIEGTEYTEGELTYSIIETPGHTPGGICIFFASEKILFTGDTLFAGSVGRTDLPGGDPRVLTASLAKLATLPDDITIYPGHGPTSTIGREKKTNCYMQRGAL